MPAARIARHVGSGIATTIPGDAPAAKGSTAGWHVVPAMSQSLQTVSAGSNPTSAMANDEVLSIADSAGTALASSDGSDPGESVTLTTCPAASTP